MKVNLQLFAGEYTTVKIYSNNGNVLLYDSENDLSVEPKTSDTIYLTANTVKINDNVVYTYNGQKRLIALGDEPNSSIQTGGFVCAPGGSFVIDESSAYSSENGLVLYIVEGTYYHKIRTYDNYQLQVESAIRDGEGVKISTNYAKKSELTSKQDTIDSSHKLSADLVDDTSTTNKFVTASDKTNWDGKQDASNNSGLNTTDKSIVGAINEVDAVAKGANQAKGFASYSALITELNSASATAYKVGQSFFVQTLEVPDLWILSVESSSSTYTYTTDAAFIAATGASGGQQVGYYKLAQLEMQKVDLSNYVPTSRTIAGVDLVDNITKTELLTALNVTDGAEPNAVASVNGATGTVVLDADDISDTNTTNKFVTSSEKSTWNAKQDALVSGTNIKTINNESILGSGNITISGSGTVSSVNNKTGNVVLDPDDLDDTNTTNKFVSATEKSTWSGKQDLIDSTHKLDYSLVDNTPTLGTAAACNTGTSSGNVPVLDSNGKLNSSVLPAIAITDTNVVATEAAMLALTAQTGDVCVRTDLNKSFILTAEPASTLANWQELLTPTDAVLSVNSKTGTVVLDADDISDSSTTNKFVTASDKTTWNGKMNSTDPTGTGSLSLNRYASDTIGTNSVAIGINTTASGENSFAGGKYSKASGKNSFAFGEGAMRSQAPEASGTRSFAIGRCAVASGLEAKAMGSYITAQRAYQLAFGRYNIADTTGADGTELGSYIEIVGNGASSARSNARTLDWNGNEWLAGKITPVGGISDGNNANYELQIPDTTSWTTDKTIATTDQIPSDYIKTSQSSGQIITATATDTPLNLKGNSGSAYLGFKNSSGGSLGYIGVNSSQKPVFYDTADHQLAYSSDIPTKTSQLTNDSGFLTSAPVTSVSGRTGAVSTANLISDMLTGNASYGDKIVGKSIGQNGYIYYQSGLCIQWGRTTYGSYNTNNTTVNFPTSFTAVYSVVATWQKGDNTTREWNIYGEPTTTSFTVRRNSSSDSSSGWSWVAIGKK